MDELIKALLQLYRFHTGAFFNLYLEELHVIPFLEGNILLTFIVYKGYIDHLKHIRRFEP